MTRPGTPADEPIARPVVLGDTFRWVTNPDIGLTILDGASEQFSDYQLSGSDTMPKTIPFYSLLLLALIISGCAQKTTIDAVIMRSKTVEEIRCNIKLSV